MNSPRIMVVLPRPVLDKLREEAKKRRIPPATFARICIEESLERAEEVGK